MRALTALVLAVATASTGAVALAAQRPEGEPATCRHQSSARFPASGRDLVVGPLVLVGGRQFSSADTVARFGGQKYPVVLRAGHRVTVQLAGGGPASLLYSDRAKDLPDGERAVADGDRAVSFAACSADRGGGSTYGGRKATFWSGFVLTSAPRCLTLRVWVDDEPVARRARLELGRRCPR
jgi:hypothetical protein